MQAVCYQYLRSRPELLRFVRLNPIWYRYLARDPKNLSELETAAKQFYGKTFSQRLEKVGDSVQMARMLMQFADSMRD